MKSESLLSFRYFDTDRKDTEPDRWRLLLFFEFKCVFTDTCWSFGLPLSKVKCSTEGKGLQFWESSSSQSPDIPHNQLLLAPHDSEMI